jgi:PAS domain-containing protein
MSGLSSRSHSHETLWLTSLHALGVIAMAFIWQHAGGLQNPLFLAVFALPVMGSIFVSRWQPYLMAALAVLAVALVAVSEAPELRWYAPWLGSAGGWLDALTGRAGGARLPFASFQAPSEYFVVLLEVFAIMVFACAVAAEYLATIFDRLDAQMWAARAEAARSQELWSTLIEQLPVPAVLLDAGTRQIVGASLSAMKKFLTGSEPVVGRDFFEAIHFSYPEAIERLIDGADGEEPLSMVKLGGRLLATEIRVQHLAQHGRRYALVVLIDTTDDFCVRAALDVAEYAALVIDEKGRVMALNRPARTLFAGASTGAELSSLVPPGGSGVRWWDPGLSGRRKTHMTVERRMYQVTASAVALPGEEARLAVIAFLPMARVAAEDQSATGSTTVVQWP